MKRLSALDRSAGDFVSNLNVHNELTNDVDNTTVVHHQQQAVQTPTLPPAAGLSRSVAAPLANALESVPTSATSYMLGNKLSLWSRTPLISAQVRDSPNRVRLAIRRSAAATASAATATAVTPPLQIPASTLGLPPVTVPVLTTPSNVAVSTLSTVAPAVSSVPAPVYATVTPLISTTAATVPAAPVTAVAPVTAGPAGPAGPVPIYAAVTPLVATVPTTTAPAPVAVPVTIPTIPTVPTFPAMAATSTETIAPVVIRVDTTTTTTGPVPSSAQTGVVGVGTGANGFTGSPLWNADVEGSFRDFVLLLRAEATLMMRHYKVKTMIVFWLFFLMFAAPSLIVLDVFTARLGTEALFWLKATIGPGALVAGFVYKNFKMAENARNDLQGSLCMERLARDATFELNKPVSARRAPDTYYAELEDKRDQLQNRKMSFMLDMMMNYTNSLNASTNVTAATTTTYMPVAAPALTFPVVPTSASAPPPPASTPITMAPSPASSATAAATAADTGHTVQHNPSAIHMV
jgi:hypothetical protein